MANWIPFATWTPVPGSLCSCNEFQEDMACYNNEKSSWFQLPTFGELGLNIQGAMTRENNERTKEQNERYPPSCDRPLSRTYIMLSRIFCELILVRREGYWAAVQTLLLGGPTCAEAPP